MHKNLLSVVVPAYNCETYIESTINNLLANPYRNIEILVGEDFSSDATGEILSKFASIPQVRVFRAPKNLGPGAIRNWLLSEAKGEYIAVQDADDSFAPERFSEQIEFLEQHKNVDVVGTAANLMDRAGNRWATLCPPERPSFLSWFLQKSVVHASIMLRKAALGGVQYNESLRVGEDYYFLTQLYLKGAQFRNIQRPLYNYHINQDDLRGRGRRQFGKILRAKWAISKLFVFPVSVVVFVLNFLKMIYGLIRSYL